MKALALALAVIAFAATPAVAQNPMSALKGKMKVGLYSYRMETDMGQIPGMPAGMGKQAHTIQHCLTEQDIDKGALAKERDGRPADQCEFKDFKMSGNTATYRMICKGEPAMASDNTITFVPDGYKAVMKMTMDQGGQKMNMTQNMEAKYLGPCKS